MKLLGMKSLHSLFIVIFLFFFSCEKKNDVQVIDKEKFINLLADLHITDAILAHRALYDGKLKDTTLSYYSYILKKYDISRAEFDYSLEYYSQDSKEYLKMYDEVTLIIKSKIPELINKNSIFRIFDLVYKDAEILNDLDKYYTPIGRELWRTKNKYTLPKDSVEKIEISQNFWYPCLFVFRADILIYPNKSSKDLKMRIVVDYKDSTKSVTEMKVFEKNKKWKRYQLLFWTDSTKKPMHFTASLLNIKNKKKLPHLKIKKISLRQYAPDKDTSKLPVLEIPDKKRIPKKRKKNR